MIILPSKRIVLLEIPRTASQAMKRFLFAHFADAVDVNPKDHHYVKVPKYAKGYSVICGVRNPYSRIYSRFARLKRLTLIGKAKQRQQVNFVDYVRNGRGESVRDFLKIAGVPRVDVAVKFEDLPTSFFDAVRIIAPAKDCEEFPNINVPASAGWQEFYNQARADVVWKATKSDFKDFGYARNSWKRVEA